MVSKNYSLTIALIFFLGVVGVGRSTIGFLYLMELVPKRKKRLLGTLTNATDAFLYIVCAFYFWMISKNVFYLLTATTVLNVLLVIGIYFVPESPDFLHDIRDYDRVR